MNELHREIDRLKLQNKDQQWRLVLNGASSPTEVLQETVSTLIQPKPSHRPGTTSVDRPNKI